MSDFLPKAFAIAIAGQVVIAANLSFIDHTSSEHRPREATAAVSSGIVRFIRATTASTSVPTARERQRLEPERATAAPERRRPRRIHRRATSALDLHFAHRHGHPHREAVDDHRVHPLPASIPATAPASATAPAPATAPATAPASATASATGFPPDHIFALAEVDRRPRPVATAPGAYPAALIDSGREAIVVVELIVATDGRVESARVLSTSPGADPAFANTALDAARAFRFEPASRAGHSVRCRLQWRFRFRVDDY